MKYSKILYSNHYLKRAKERFGYDKDTAIKKANEAYEQGDLLPEELKEFYIRKTQPNPPNTFMYIYEDRCYVFSINDNMVREKELPKVITIYKIKI
jgi:hypothetical protein